MIFVDASAMIAMIAGEADADALADRLATDPVHACSALSVWETVAGLCRSYTFSVEAADSTVRRFLAFNGFRFVTIAEAEYAMAKQAYAEFGRGRHAAALNMGDCFAYACAKANDARLLFKGADFAKTDIRAA
jgi:ribonuclease VapC